MNELEKYREDYFTNLVKNAFGEEPGKKLFDKENSLLYDFLKEGFNAAIALDLPVKFAEWQDSLRYEGSLHRNNVSEEVENYEDLKELYQYWITNIFKPE